MLIYLLLVNSITITLTSHPYQSVIINNVFTSVDLSTQLIKIDHIITFTSSINNLKSFLFMVDSSLIYKVSKITAFTDKTKTTDQTLPIKYERDGVWSVFFYKSMAQNESKSIIISVVCTNVIKSYPSRITQHEKHLVLYDGPVSLFSPFIIMEHISTINIGDGVLLSLNKPENFEEYGNPLKLKKISLINFLDKPFINSIVKIHYEHKKKFLTVKTLHRTIEISHWGFISVSDTITLENSGAKLRGPYQRRLFEDSDPTAVKGITTVLPTSASKVIMYDELGLISTAQVTEHYGYTEMKFLPRFVLYGGWKSKYTVEYQVPSYEYLFNEQDDFILKMRFIDHIFDDMVIDSAVVKVIIPEGSVKGKIVTPYEVQYSNDSYYKSYLDTYGRIVITMKKENMVEEHIQDFLLNYTFSKYRMLYEPIYVITFFQLIFVFIIFVRRWDFCLVNEECICEESKVIDVIHQNSVDQNSVRPKVSRPAPSHLRKSKKKRH